ncbi:hypothetical protein HO966_09305 [Streptococcus suis]|uniref:hypothetical protein n=1 Tax=Streptococcus suis TaxID=1307 RepID=UPI000424EEE1|nr:hypothetical protein [Streptococcus suis]HEM3195776.1 hypothetical protein [Streptococcus suis 10581]MBY4978366.1 hypothetical protein [Streptococcus suis]MBY4978413.1 hypothetical protein [Streptococcus suis]NQG19996.1 hypothetical protein [Streptococcus suis]NQO44581.1 hypothetical protein [Streptococcus suis]
MVVTGKKVFKAVYFASLISHISIIGYQMSQSVDISGDYLVLATSSVVSMTLIMMLTKDKGE